MTHLHRLPAEHSGGIATQCGPDEQTADCQPYRVVAQLLPALLRKTVHHPSGCSPRHSNPFRNIPGPIFHGRQCRTKGIAQCETLRKRTLPVNQLFWRPYQKRNRQNRPGIYTRQNYQHRQRTAASPLRVHQSDSLSTRFPVPAALHSCIQESHRNDSQ